MRRKSSARLIKSKGNILGVLEIVNKTTNGPFAKDDLNLILRIVDHAAIAIEKASLYQKMEELSITDDLTKLFNTRYLDRTLEPNVFLKKEGYTLKLTASFGVASYPESAKSKEELLRLADEAMYRVKYQTRNGVYAIV